jgi:hypothetical protein
VHILKNFSTTEILISGNSLVCYQKYTDHVCKAMLPNGFDPEQSFNSTDFPKSFWWQVIKEFIALCTNYQFTPHYSLKRESLLWIIILLFESSTEEKMVTFLNEKSMLQNSFRNENSQKFLLPKFQKENALNSLSSKNQFVHMIRWSFFKCFCSLQNRSIIVQFLVL